MWEVHLRRSFEVWDLDMSESDFGSYADSEHEDSDPTEHSDSEHEDSDPTEYSDDEEDEASPSGPTEPLAHAGGPSPPPPAPGRRGGPSPPPQPPFGPGGPSPPGPSRRLSVHSPPALVNVFATGRNADVNPNVVCNLYTCNFDISHMIHYHSSSGTFGHCNF